MELQKIINNIKDSESRGTESSSSAASSSSASSSSLFVVLRDKIKQLSDKLSFKYDNENDICLIYSHYTIENADWTPLERECRSIILRMSTLDILCYTFDDLYYSVPTDAEIMEIQESIEGTTIAIYYDDKFARWRISTRKCIDIADSFWNGNHRDLFYDTISEYNDFFGLLDKSKSYIFIIVHHKNKYLVDYTSVYGKNYAKLIHIITRDNQSFAVVNDELPFHKPKTYSSIDEGLNQNNYGNEYPLKSEGIIIKINYNNKVNYCYITPKIYNDLSLLLPRCNNKLMGLIQLYLNNKLNDHCNQYGQKYVYYDNNKLLHVIDKYNASLQFKYNITQYITLLYHHISLLLQEIYDELYNGTEIIKGKDHIYNDLNTTTKAALYKLRGLHYKFSNVTDNNVKKLLKSLSAHEFSLLIYQMDLLFDKNEILKSSVELINSTDNLF